MGLRIADLQNDSIVDGPGLRFTVFTQGCPHRCEGCHNPGTHPLAGGREITVEEIAEKLRHNPLLSGVTFSGGEPFLQPEPLALLGAKAHDLGLSVWCYTGYTWEALLEGTVPGAMALLEQVDVLVDGLFLLSRRTLDAPFRGSRNQRLIDVKKSFDTRAVVLWEDPQEKEG